jgi:hypothetical protein
MTGHPTPVLLTIKPSSSQLVTRALHVAVSLAVTLDRGLYRCLLHEKRQMAILSSPCDIGHSARSSSRSCKRGRPTRCRAGISDRHIQWLPAGSHTADRHRRGTAPELKRMRATCVAVRSLAKSGCLRTYTSEIGRISAILPEMRRLPNSTKTPFPTLGSAPRQRAFHR